MSLRLLADHCVPRSAIRTLQAAGHEVLILAEHAPPDSEDSVVIAKSQELGAILVSLNGDFANITAYPPSQYKGIVALQVRNHPEAIPPLMQRLVNYLAIHPGMTHYEGRLFLVEVHRIRVRK
jgi:predicted nuclease of predicted toxin-antitoxin system